MDYYTIHGDGNHVRCEYRMYALMIRATFSSEDNVTGIMTEPDRTHTHTHTHTYKVHE